MNWKKSLIVAVAAASLFCAAGCKKASVEDSKAVAAAAALTDVTDHWNKKDVNALLGFIPADTFGVMATTRQIDMKSSGLKIVLSHSDELLEKLMTYLKAQVGGDEALMANVNSIWDAIAPLIKNYAENAPKWGLDPDAHFDQVIYFNDATLVTKMTVRDGDLFREKVMPILVDYVQMIVNSEASHKALKIEPKEITAGGEKWTALDFSAIASGFDASTIAIHFGKKLITVAIVNANDTAALEKALKPADKPMTKDDLGKVSDNTITLGFFNHVKFAEVLANSGSLGKMLKENDASGCIEDFKALVASVPMSYFKQEIRADGVAHSSAVLAIADKEELKKLQSLTADRPDIITDKSIFGLSMNLNIASSIAYLKDLAERFKNHQFACKPLQQVQSSQRFLRELNGVIQTVDNRQISMFTSAVNGVTMTIDKFNFENNKLSSLEAMIDVSGPELSEKYPAIALLAGLASRELKDVLSLTKDEVKEVDLMPLLGEPLKLNALLTNTDLIYATTNYDVKKISSKSRKTDGRIFYYSFKPELMDDVVKSSLNLLDKDSKLAFDLLKRFSMSSSLSVTSEGLAFEYEVQF